MNTARIAIGLLLLLTAPVDATPPRTPNAFYAMDTCTRRPYPKDDISPARQLDLLKELGYAGVAWTEEDPQKVRAVRAEAELRGLRMFAIYGSAKVSTQGELTVSPLLEPLLEVLDGHGTLVWLHIGGKGPDIASLAADAPAIVRLRDLSAKAACHHLELALYPHVGDWTERVADAIRVARLVDRPNFGVTFNLCHCLAMGDEARIPELLRQAAPYLKTVTINGADAGVKGPRWDRLIQTLDRGSFDLGKLLVILRGVGFDGPIGLQGYGIGGDRRDNLSRSIGAWRRISERR